MNAIGRRHRDPDLAVRGLALAVVVGALVVGAGCASPPPQRPAGGIPTGNYDYLKLRTSFEIKQAMKDSGAKSYVIAVVDGTETVWMEAFGLADAERASPAEVTTMYRMGSVSKLFTAVGLMQLVDQGKVDLDAPISRYLDGFTMLPPPPALVGDGGWTPDDVSIRSILTHHSGIPGDLFAGMIGKTPRDLRTYKDALKDEHAAAPTHLVHAYSNVAMTLLGHVVERVSGQPYEEFMRKRVLRPLGMKHADFDLTTQIKARLAQGHQKGAVKEMFPIGEKPAGSLYASVEEMAQFLKFLVGGGTVNGNTVLKKEKLEEMWVRQNADVPLDLDLEMGLAFFLEDEPVPGAGLMVEHGGATIYHRSQVVALPQHGLAVVVMTNSAEGGTSKIAKDALLLALETKTGLRRPEKMRRAEETSDAFTAAELDALAGTYDSVFGFLRLTRDDDVLAFRAFGEQLELVPTADRTFHLQVKLFGFIPYSPGELGELVLAFADVGEHKAIIALDGEKRSLAGTRVDAPPFTDAWRARLGRYVVANPGTDYLLFDRFELKDDGGALVFTTGPAGETVSLAYGLAPVDDTRAVILGLGRNRGESVRVVVHDGQEALRWSGYTLARAP